MDLRDLLTDVRSSVRPLASARQTTVALRCSGALPELGGNEASLSGLLKALLSELIRLTPREGAVLVAARAVPRGAGWGRGTWVEVSLHSRKAHMGDRELHRILKTVGSVKLVDVATDLYRGELRLTLLCRLVRIKGGWFVIRRSAQEVPTFAVVVRAASRRAISLRA
jgi:hypothetical protein